MIPWEGGETSATSIDKSIHRSLRHTLVSGMSNAALKQFEPAIHANLDIYFEKLLERRTPLEDWSQAENMISWSTSYLLTRIGND